MIEVPVTLVPDDDPRLRLPYVVLEVDGEPLEVLLDSGAARTQLVERPGLAVRDEDGAAPSAGAFGAPTRHTATALVHCRLGGLGAGALPVAVVPAGRPGAGDLVGQDVLGQFRCEYRLADALLVLDAEPPAATHPVHLDERRHVHLDLAWAGEEQARASAVLDTGASVTVVDRAFAERHSGLLTPAGSSAGTDATGTTVETPMAVLRGPHVLGERLDDLLVAVVDLTGANATLTRPMDVILGWTALVQADWYVDHAGSRAACRRRAQYP